MRRCAGIAAAVVFSASLVGCGSSGTSATPTSSAGSRSPVLTGKIIVFAASSLTGTFITLGKQFEAAHPGTSVVFSFGASSTLAQQILQGAPADLFASAAPKNMQQVIDGGDVSVAKDFARNEAEIVVYPAKATEIRTVADLGRPGVKVALCLAQVPCGAVARSVLASNNVVVKPVTEGLDVKSTLAYAVSGEADAAIVYVTDAKAAGKAVVGVPIPSGLNASTAYSLGVVQRSANGSLATAFEEFVLSQVGRGVLEEAGFLSP
jgi:molybdate transport system substrate-binding protein